LNGRPSFQGYYNQIAGRIAAKLEKENLDHLLGVDFEEYLDYLVDEVRWEPLEWYEDHMTVEPFVATREAYDQFFERRFTAQIEMLRLRIPISSHPWRDNYFEHQPSSGRIPGEPEWKFGAEMSGDTPYEFLIHEVEASERAVEDGLDEVRFWLGNRNKDIEQGNQRLRDLLRPVWEAKRKQLEERTSSTQSLLQKLNIPLYQGPAGPKPVEIKPRQLRTVIQKPTARVSAQEPALKRDDVTKLVDFIEQYSKQFEVSPKPFAKLGEEELRDVLVGMMNANYPGSTTAETFSKLGKTDISFRVDSGHVLIGECKFWSGAKAYGEAIDQLFSYLTWRHSYGVLLHFCRLKDMSRAVSEAQKASNEHPSFTKGGFHPQTETRFSSRHSHPQDAARLVEIHHLFVDLSL
jgi:hypothetical protein